MTVGTFYCLVSADAELCCDFNGGIHLAIYSLVSPQFAFCSKKAGGENKNRFIFHLKDLHSLAIDLYSIDIPILNAYRHLYTSYTIFYRLTIS
jgi:hypothetical protein